MIDDEEDPYADEMTPAQRRLLAMTSMYSPNRKKRELESLDEESDDIAFGMDPYSAKDITDEDLGEIVGLGGLDEELTENNRQRMLAEEIRNRSAPEGRDSGRVYTAANPLEHIGAFLEKRQARKEIEGLEKGRGDIMAKQKGTRSKIADLIRGKRKKPLGDLGLKMPSLDDEYNVL